MPQSKSATAELLAAETTELVDFFPDVRKQLDFIARDNETLVIDFGTIKGIKEAKSQVAKLKKLNGAIDRQHKVIKDPILQQARLIDGAKKELKARVAEMVAVHQGPLDEIAQREQRRGEAIVAQFEHIDDIKAAINIESTSAAAIYSLAALHAIELTEEVFQERLDEAKAYHEVVVQQVAGFGNAAKLREDQAKQVAELQARVAERDQQDRDRRIAEEAAENAAAAVRAQAEHEKAQAEEKLSAEREEVERHQLDLLERVRVAEAEKEESEKRAKLAAEQAIKAEKERVAAEAKAKEEAEAKRLADESYRAQVEEEAIDDLAELMGGGVNVVFQAIKNGKVRNVTINY